MEIIKIMIAEDHVLFRKTLAEELFQKNIVTIGQASDGEGLLNLMQTLHPDVVLLDLEMPGMNGNNSFILLKEKHPDVKVIIFSQHDEAGLIENFIARGAHGYLPKNLIARDTGLLSESIREVNEGRYCFYYFDQANKEIKYTRREVEMIPLILEGKTNKAIAKELGVSLSTIEKQRQQLYKKTQSTTTADFFRYVFKKGLEFLGQVKKRKLSQ